MVGIALIISDYGYGYGAPQTGARANSAPFKDTGYIRCCTQFQMGASGDLDFFFLVAKDLLIRSAAFELWRAVLDEGLPAFLKILAGKIGKDKVIIGL